VPSSDQIGAFDAMIITGSHYSAYEDLPWIKNLEALIRNVYDEHHSVRLYGSCFGHQIIAQSLLGRDGSAVVEPDPGGWEVGVQEIQLVPEFRQSFPRKQLDSIVRPPTPPEKPMGENRDPNTLRLQFVHADHVKLSTTQTLPKKWMLIGKTSQCANQGMYEPGRVLTFQGHFEFDSFINYETVKVFGSNWELDDLQRRLESTRHEDDSDEVAKMVIKFMLGMDGASNGQATISGLATPPELEARRGWLF
jgi:GMP synthase-like glutamine amidotransferase